MKRALITCRRLQMGILGGANSTKHSYLLHELPTILLPNFV